MAEETSDSAADINALIVSIDKNISRAQDTLVDINSQSEITLRAVDQAAGDIQQSLDFVNDTSIKLNTTSNQANTINQKRITVEQNFNDVASFAEQFNATTEQVAASVSQMLNNIENIVSSTDTIKHSVEDMAKSE